MTSHVARHEAAHCVVALDLGIGIEQVTIVPSGRQGGLTTFDVHVERLDEREAWNVAVGALAGPVIDRIAFGRSVGGAGDFEIARRVLKNDADALLSAYAAAERRVERALPSIEDIARALEWERTLSGSSLVALLARVRRAA